MESQRTQQQQQKQQQQSSSDSSCPQADADRIPSCELFEEVSGGRLPVLDKSLDAVLSMKYTVQGPLWEVFAVSMLSAVMDEPKTDRRSLSNLFFALAHLRRFGPSSILLKDITMEIIEHGALHLCVKSLSAREALVILSRQLHFYAYPARGCNPATAAKSDPYESWKSAVCDFVKAAGDASLRDPRVLEQVVATSQAHSESAGWPARPAQWHT